MVWSYKQYKEDEHYVFSKLFTMADQPVTFQAWDASSGSNVFLRNGGLDNLIVGSDDYHHAHQALICKTHGFTIANLAGHLADTHSDLKYAESDHF
jgi:hypothetical protein